MYPNVRVKITTEGDRLKLSAHYLPAFAPDARKIGGTYRVSWWFDVRDRDRVAELVTRHYGTTDTDTCERRTVRITAEEFPAYEKSFYFLGRLIAERRAKNSAVRLGDGVIVVAGSFPYKGGSEKYPDLDPSEDLILEIRDVPADHPDLNAPGVTPIAEERQDRRAQLIGEREELSRRLAEIADELAQRAAES